MKKKNKKPSQKQRPILQEESKTLNNIFMNFYVTAYIVNLHLNYAT